MAFRIGTGYDVHKLEVGPALVLGGITIPHHKGSVGHSDADVLIHAICDALFGAADMGDIGFHFPDNDPEYRGIDSKILLQRCIQRIMEKGFRVINIDSTVMLQQPRISSYVPKMKQALAEVLLIDSSQISIKATSTEKLGFIGREEGIAAQAVALIEKS